MTPTVLAFIGPIGTFEMIVIAILGLLIFGKRLPEVGKNLGKGIVEFKKGLQGVDEDVRETSTRAAAAPPRQLNSQTTPALPSGTADDLRAENERLRAQLADKNRQA
jgi:sec-independent protein translocase protein TatA